MIKVLNSIIVCISGLLLTFALLFAAPLNVPQTGQTLTYSAGDDGTSQTGIPFPSPRFVDNGDGTVTDRLTDLVWLKDANCFAMQDWSGAITSANTLNTSECGLTDGSNEGDWRLPNLNELRSVIDLGFHEPALSNSNPFSNVQGTIGEDSSWYWTSTTLVQTPSAWRVSLAEGITGLAVKTEVFSVWPVKGGL